MLLNQCHVGLQSSSIKQIFTFASEPPDKHSQTKHYSDTRYIFFILVCAGHYSSLM